MLTKRIALQSSLQIGAIFALWTTFGLCKDSKVLHWTPRSTVEHGYVTAFDFLQKMSKPEVLKSAGDVLSTSCNKKLGALALGVYMNNSKAVAEVAHYIDSLAKPGSGLFDGNIYWYGAFKECKSVSTSLYCQSKIQISLKSILHIEQVVPVTVGVCSPYQCTEDDIAIFLERAIKENNLTNIIKVDRHAMEEKFGSPVICNAERTYSNGAIAALALTGVLALLCILGTLYDMLRSMSSPTMVIANKANKFMPVQSISNESNENSVNIQTNPLSGYESDENRSFLPQTDAKQKQGNICLEFIRCFSLTRNTKEIFACELPKGAITSVNGIRALSMFWIILSHTYFYLLEGPVDNLRIGLKILHRFTFQPIANGYVGVDTFFLLSGLLVSYLSMRRMSKNGKLPLIPYYLHRFLRLTPSYMFVILIYMYVYPLIGTGPSWFTQLEKYSEASRKCRKYWWTNLLYISNFYPTSLAEECLGWSWYLSNDMQFYIISPIIIYMMYRFKKIGAIAANGFVLLASFIVTASLFGIKKLDALLTEDLGRSIATSLGFADIIYIKPYCRIQPYIVGMVLGYILHQDVPSIVKRKRWVVPLVGWAVATALALAVVFGPYTSFKEGGRPFTETENILYGTFSRFTWGIAIAVVIYLCHYGMGGVVNSILSWKALIPFSRLTYSAYLVHPIIISVYYYSLEKPMHYADIAVVYLFLSFLSMAYICAYILAVMVEFPIMNIQKLLLKF